MTDCQCDAFLKIHGSVSEGKQYLNVVVISRNWVGHKLTSGGAYTFKDGVKC